MKSSQRFLVEIALGLALFGGLVAETGCQRKQTAGGPIRIARKTPPAESAPLAVNKAAAPADPNAPDQIYQTVVRPMLNRHGCTAGPCHAGFRGGGFEFQSGLMDDQHDYRQVLERIDRKNPESSELIKKATNQIQHNGGRNLDVGSCDYKRLIAWISQKPDIACSDEPPADPQRFAREVVPALKTLGCVTCHGEASQAQARFDLSPLRSTPPQTDRALRAFEATNPTRFMSWASPVLRAASGEDAHHTAKVDPRSCAYRRLYGYVAQSPELTCDLSETAPNKELPEFAPFAEHILPNLAKRGCFNSSCHGGGVGDMSLYGLDATNLTKGWHEYLALTARVEDFAHVEKSTFLTTARNEVSHGGGQRLGGPGDCVDQMVVNWLTRKPLKPCPPPSPPTYERFVQEIQPVLDKMTCSSRACHGEKLDHFRLRRHATDPESLRHNYDETVQRIDLDFMPFSAVQLRMREPCAYSIVAAWITNKPKPTCVVQTPDPSIFPKMEEDLPTHAKPGPPPPNKKS